MIPIAVAMAIMVKLCSNLLLLNRIDWLYNFVVLHLIDSQSGF